MSNGNRQGEGEKRVLMCPFLKEYCVGERCAIHEKLTRVVGGMKQEAGMCGIAAVTTLLSEINTVLRQQKAPMKIDMPMLYRG